MFLVFISIWIHCGQKKSTIWFQFFKFSWIKKKKTQCSWWMFCEHLKLMYILLLCSLYYVCVYKMCVYLYILHIYRLSVYYLLIHSTNLCNLFGVSYVCNFVICFLFFFIFLFHFSYFAVGYLSTFCNSFLFMTFLMYLFL